MLRALVRYCPEGAPTFDEMARFGALPRIGETIVRDDERWTVVEVEHEVEGMSVFIIAHAPNRPRALRARGIA